MMEDPDIIRMNIADYQAMLKAGMDDETRRAVERFLAEAQQALVRARESKTPRQR